MSHRWPAGAGAIQEGGKATQDKRQEPESYNPQEPGSTNSENGLGAGLFPTATWLAPWFNLGSFQPHHTSLLTHKWMLPKLPSAW